MTKKYKTRDEWKKLLLELSYQEFQDICYDILQKNTFQNIKPRGKGGDGGRDIEAEFIQKIGKETITQRFWFQCKQYGNTPLNYKSFSTEVVKAQNENIDRYVVMSNKDMTSDTKTEIEKWNKSNKCQISDWTGTIFIDMLWESPNVCKTYFPDEEVPPLVDTNDPKTLIQQSANLGKRFGVELHLQVNKETNINNPYELADILKEALIGLKDVDINIRALIYQKISMFFFSLERADDALTFLNKSLEITPKNQEALLNKGYILEKINQLDDSTACYDEILNINSKNKLALNNKAHNLRRRGKLGPALKLIESSLEIDPEFIVAIHTKTNILKTLDRSDEALTFLDSKSNALKKSVGLQQLKIDLYIDLIDLKKANKLNQEILKKNPNDVNALNNQGVIFEKNSKYQHKEKYLKLAFDCFEQTITKNKKFSFGWANKTAVLLNAGQIDQAEEIIDSAYAFFPRNPYVLNKKGCVLRVRNRPKEALNYFDKALKFYYQDEFLIDRAKTYIDLGQWRKAISDANQVLKNNKKNSEAWLVKAQASRPLHEPTKAKLYEKKAKECQKKPKSLLED